MSDFSVVIAARAIPFLLLAACASGGDDRPDQLRTPEPVTTPSDGYGSAPPQPTGYVIRPSPRQVWLQDKKLNSMINPQGRVYEVVPVYK